MKKHIAKLQQQQTPVPQDQHKMLQQLETKIYTDVSVNTKEREVDQFEFLLTSVCKTGQHVLFSKWNSTMHGGIGCDSVVL